MVCEMSQIVALSLLWPLQDVAQKNYELVFLYCRILVCVCGVEYSILLQVIHNSKSWIIYCKAVIGT